MQEKEILAGYYEIVKGLENRVVVLFDPQDMDKSDLDLQTLGKKRNTEYQYAFDYVFDEESTQEDVFRNTTEFLLDGAIQGYNSTVFAYGATGAGKTYTMLGTSSNPGVMCLTFDKLFRLVSQEQSDHQFQIKLSYLEIYNEVIRDLLAKSPHEKSLELWEDPMKGSVV